MPPKPDSPYNPAPTAAPETSSGNDYLNVRSDPNAFGAQIGNAEQEAGQKGQEVADKGMDYATKVATMATEAKTNDVIANQWGPAVADLSGKYRQLQGKDAIDGYQPYVDSLQKLRTQYIGQATSPLEQNLLGNYMTRHLSAELDSAKRWQDTQLTSYEDQSAEGFVKEQGSIATTNYTDANMVNGAKSAMEAMILKHGLDRGLPMEAIKENQQNAWGQTAASIVSRAVANHDVEYANNFYGEHKDSIPGHQQLEIDKMLSSETMQATGSKNAQALLSGLPPPGISPTVQAARSATADAANAVGIDPNHALTILKIETSDGQNLGKRGDIGQTGKGGTLEDQAQHLAEEAKKSKDVADNALGRDSQPWEQYVCYQQGAGGGPALLKADPNAKAVDVLSPLYSSPQKALSAVKGNGGNATMSAGQFLDFIKQKYTEEAQRAAIAPLPADTSTVLGANPKPAVAMQPGATPVQSLMEMDKVYPDAIQRANAIPNMYEREATLKSLEQQHSVYQQAAGAWKTQFVNKAQTLAMDPGFTSTDQIPPDMRSALADNPITMQYLETRANYNLEHGAGTVTKDQREYGPGFYDAFKAVHAPADSPDRISDITQLQSRVGPKGDLTIAGYDKLAKELQNKGTPEGEAEGMMKKQFFANAKGQISGADEGLHIKDPKGDEIFLKFMAHALPAYEKGKSEGKSPAQLLSPDSPDYIGKSIETFKRPMSQWVSDMMQDGQTATRTLPDIIKEAQATNDPAKKAALKAEAQKLGLVAPDNIVPKP